MSNTIFDLKPKMIELNTIRKRVIKSIQNKDLVFYIAAVSTIAGGILHLLMLGPALKPANFPMQLLPYTDGLFTISGILQILWCIPMIKRWGKSWYYIGLVGTIALSMLLLMTRIPNGITNLPLEDKNPMALLTEISQFLFIGVTIIIIIKYESFDSNKFNKIINYLKYGNKTAELNKYNNQWFRERYEIKNKVISESKLNRLQKEKINSNLETAKTLCAEGIRLSKCGRDDEAIRYFEAALKINSQYIDALYNMGVSLNKLGRKTEAIDIYVKAKHIQSLNYPSK